MASKHLPLLTTSTSFPLVTAAFFKMSVWNDFLAVTIAGTRPSKECFDALYIRLSIPF